MLPFTAVSGVIVTIFRYPDTLCCKIIDNMLILIVLLFVIDYSAKEILIPLLHPSIIKIKKKLLHTGRNDLVQNPPQNPSGHL